MSVLSSPVVYTYTSAAADALTVTGIGPIRRQDDRLSILDTVSDANRCHVTIGDHAGTTAPEPPVGANVGIVSLGRTLFGGTAIQTHQEYETGKKNHLKWHVDLIDYTWQFNRFVPFEVYTATSVTAIVADLLTNYAPGFTGVHVEAGLPLVTIEFDGSLNLGGCLDKLCALIGAKWKVDYVFDLHLSVAAETDEVPDDLVNGSPTLALDPPVRYGRDMSQIRTRVYVRGTACFAVVDDVPAQTALAAITGGSGIYEAPVINRPELLTAGDCTAYGQTVLAVWSRTITEIDYVTYDPKTASGKTVHVNLTNPPIVGDFVIQSVTIDEIAESLYRFPRYSVHASSVRFTIDDLWAQINPQTDVTGNAATAGALNTPRNIQGEAFDGSADIDISKRTTADSGLRLLS